MSITSAATAGFVSRAAWGARRPRSVSRNISPGNGGVALHYGGNNTPVSSHNDCLRVIRSWQNYHMDGHGWVDIAYSMLVCQHGYVFAGRGAGVRTAANGSNHGNNTHYAVCWIGGARQTPTAAAMSAYAWAIRELRNSGGAGRSVKPHNHFNSTACPGSTISNAARQVDGRNIGGGGTTPSDPWEEYYMSLSGSDRKKMDKLMGLSEGRIDNLIEYAGTIGSNKLNQLDEFVTQLSREEMNAQSLVRQFALNHRERLPRVEKFVDDFERLVDSGDTSMQGVVIGGINAIDAIRDMGYTIETGSRHGVQKS